MEPQPESTSRLRWVAIAALCLGALAGLAILLDLGPFAGEELTEAELVARGDEICRQAHTEFEELQDSSPATAREAAALTGELIGISRDELEAVRDLDSSETLDAALDRYLAARERGIDRLRAGLEAAEDGDSAAYAEAQADVAAGQPARAKLAREIGFKECSSLSAPP